MGSIRLDRVGKVFPGNTVAVREVDLSVEDGEFVVFVGPSGCGKSTLLRMIAGLETITSGEIRINDKVVNSIAPRDRDIAMVFQSYALYPQMTVRQNIAFALELRRFSRQEIAERVAEAARILDLTELLDRKPGQLSGGQRQRVAMGRAIVRHPQAFLLDEPLSNLDAKLRVQLRAELGRLHARLGVTTIHVTHDQVEAMTLGSRVAVFSRGMLQQYDTPHALYHAPANVFVAGFIGSPAMNLLEATVAEAGAAPAVTVGGVRIGLGAQPRAGRLAAGDKVILGVRPEHLLVRPQTAEAQDALPARVELVEHLEPESYVAVTPSVPAVVRASDDFTRGTADADRTTAAARMITLRVSASRLPARGEPIQIAVEPGRAHLFDMTGAAL